jgi:phenylalanyl-tRNA synthetase beta chain
LSSIIEKQAVRSNYKPASIFPEAVRDLAFLVKKEVSHTQILKELQKTDALLKNIELFDVYEGKNIFAGCKSMAYRLTYADSSRTLTTVEVDTAVDKAKQALEKKFDVEIR